jgi:hypothetical protein
MRIRDFGKLIEFGSPQHQQKLTPTQTRYTWSKKRRDYNLILSNQKKKNWPTSTNNYLKNQPRKPPTRLSQDQRSSM